MIESDRKRSFVQPTNPPAAAADFRTAEPWESGAPLVHTNEPNDQMNGGPRPLLICKFPLGWRKMFPLAI